MTNQNQLRKDLFLAKSILTVTKYNADLLRRVVLFNGAKVVSKVKKFEEYL